MYPGTPKMLLGYVPGYPQCATRACTQVLPKCCSGMYPGTNILVYPTEHPCNSPAFALRVRSRCSCAICVLRVGVVFHRLRILIWRRCVSGKIISGRTTTRLLRAPRCCRFCFKAQARKTKKKCSRGGALADLLTRTLYVSNTEYPPNDA